MSRIIDLVYKYLGSSPQSSKTEETKVIDHDLVQMCLQTESNLALELIKFKNHLKNSNQTIGVHSKTQETHQPRLSVYREWEEWNGHLHRIFNHPPSKYTVKKTNSRIEYVNNEEASHQSEEDIRRMVKGQELAWKNSELFEHPELTYSLRRQFNDRKVSFEIAPYDRTVYIVEYRTN